MSGWNKVITLLGSDLLKEPFRLIDRQLQVYNERVNKQHEQDLFLAQKDFLVKLNIYDQEMTEKINKLKDDRELTKQIKILESIGRYQKEMSAYAAAISQRMSNMNKDLFEEMTKLVEEKESNFELMKNKAIENASEQLAKIDERFSNESNAKRIMESAVEKSLNNILDSGSNYMRIIHDEFQKSMEHIKTIQNQATINVNEYLSPALAKIVEQKLANRNQEIGSFNVTKQLE